MIEPIDYKSLLKGFVVGIIICFVIFIFSLLDQRTKIVFCDVGQGDAAYIRIKNRYDVLIDAGPDKKVLNCLGRYMPFYDKTIEMVILSHPQKDHFGGLEYVSDRYIIKKLLLSPIESPNKTFAKLKNKLQNKKISINNVFNSIKLNVFSDIFYFYWPKNQCLSRDENDCSLVFSFAENFFTIMFTGDASSYALNSLSKGSFSKVTVLKIPHHGSKNGLTEKFLRLADPEVAVISVGKNNSYGHPAQEILDLLKAHKVKIRRTDVEGNIIFKVQSSKGKSQNFKLN